MFVQQPRAPGVIAQRFHEARTPAAAREALKVARLELWGASPEHARRKDVPESLATHVDRFLGADEDVVLALIERFDLAVGTGDPEAEIMAVLERHPLAVSSRVAICEDLLGWLKRKIDRQIAAGDAALVSQEDFHRRYLATVRKIDRGGVALAATARQPTDEDIERELLSRVLVDQLAIIDADQGDQRTAVALFMRASAERSKWSETGEVHEDSFLEFEEALEREWDRTRKAHDLDHRAEPEAVRGRRLHLASMGVRLKVQGMEVPDHFTPGSYHAMADELRLGWHPNFRELVRKPSDT